MLNYIRNVFCLACLVLAVACSSSPEGDPAPGTGGAGAGRGGRGGRGGGTVPVVTAHVTQKSMPVSIPGVGTVEAISSVQIRAQVTGQLGAIHFSEGQEVKKGQRLFSLDARPFQAALQQAEAVLARDTATASNARSQKTRSEDLFKRGLIPRDQYESLSAGAAALDATVAADRAAVETAKLNLQYTEIKAPITGRTGALGVHEGDLIRANDTTPMVVINQLTPVYVSFAVPGRYLAEVRRYQGQKALPVLATMPSSVVPGALAQPAPSDEGAPAGRGRGAVPAVAIGPDTEQGRVTFIDNAVDPTTGTIRLKGTFENRNRQLWPGVFVQVMLQLTADANALVVPATAVQASQDGQYVYVVKDDRTVEMRTVQAERQVGNEMVIAAGVKNGEEVVTDGHLRLTPGARVSTGGRGEGGGGERGGGERGRGEPGAGERGGAERGRGGRS
jgi:membrane fusion protein, multidrug efflux system